MILLMGICMSLTKYPMKPIMAKPTAVANAIFWNSKHEMNNAVQKRYQNRTFTSNTTCMSNS